MNVTRTIYSEHQGAQVMRAIWDALKPRLALGKRFVISVEPETRNNEQNALLHAMLGEIARKIEWAGARRDIETWKRLLVAAWLRARGESVSMLPALDGHGFDVVYSPTHKLSKADMAELIDYVTAWAAEHGIFSPQTEADR